MAQPQRLDDVHQDELFSPNKRYELMDANKKIDLDNLLYSNESKIMANIIQNHPLRFNIAASSYVSWIYLGHFSHTFQEDGSKYRLKFALGRKEILLLMISEESFICLKLPITIMNDLSPSNFKTTGLVQPWQILGKIAQCLTTRVTGHDQPPLQIMQMLYCFVNNIHVDYVELLWEGSDYALQHLSTQIPYLRFTKLIVGHYMTVFPKISHSARDKYQNLEDNVMVKNIYNSGKHKDSVEMNIPSWMITDEMKLTYHYRIYAVVFAVDVPTTQSQLIESTHRTHKTISAPRRSTRLTPLTPVLTTGEADDIILQDTIQLSLAEQKSHDELESKQNVQQVKEHLIAEEIEKLVEGAENVENVEVNSSTLRQNDTQNILGTRLEPRSDKESLEVEITAEVQPVNINEEEEESAEDDYELKRREKGKHVEESRSTSSPTTIRSRRTHCTHISLDIEKLQELTDDLPIWLSLKYKFERLHVATTLYRPSAVHPRDQDDPHDDAHPEGENIAKRHKTSEHGTFNPHAKIFYIKKQKDPEKPKEVVYSNLKIVQIIKTYWELGHEHKFITEIIARRANGSIVSITKSEYKNLNKNDIKDMYMLFVNNNVDDYARLDLLCHCQSPIRSTVESWE
ncbi:hypothetical protein Tco_0472605 [Tanacetum coccineum]